MKKFALAFVSAGVAVSTFVLAQPPLTVRTPPQFEMAPGKLPEKPVQDAILGLLTAIEADDYANFLRIGDDEFKTDLTKEKFTRMVEITAARLEKGYNVIYFGDMKKSPYTIYLWKLSFKDGGRDVLGEISLRDDKVVGIFIH